MQKLCYLAVVGIVASLGIDSATAQSPAKPKAVARPALPAALLVHPNNPALKAMASAAPAAEPAMLLANSALRAARGAAPATVTPSKAAPMKAAGPAPAAGAIAANRPEAALKVASAASATEAVRPIAATKLKAVKVVPAPAVLPSNAKFLAVASAAAPGSASFATQSQPPAELRINSTR
jgi:hypothetical protein